MSAGNLRKVDTYMVSVYIRTCTMQMYSYYNYVHSTCIYCVPVINENYYSYSSLLR